MSFALAHTKARGILPTEEILSLVDPGFRSDCCPVHHGKENVFEWERSVMTVGGVVPSICMSAISPPVAGNLPVNRIDRGY